MAEVFPEINGLFPQKTPKSTSRTHQFWLNSVENSVTDSIRRVILGPIATIQP